MDTLLDVIQQETELVRAGHLAQAVELEQTKTELSRLYIADTLRLRANQAQLATISPETMPELIRRHNDFRALLQINLTVLATAHAVSEGIVRGRVGRARPQGLAADLRRERPHHRARPAQRRRRSRSAGCSEPARFFSQSLKYRHGRSPALRPQSILCFQIVQAIAVIAARLSCLRCCRFHRFHRANHG